MNFSEITNAAYQRLHDYTKKDVEEVSKAVFEVIGELLVQKYREDDKIKTPVGIFTLKTRAARTGRNPVNGERIVIPESQGWSFKLASNLKRELNGK